MFIWSQEQKKSEDVSTTYEEVTHSITSFLKYTSEKKENFRDGYIPTLDCKIRVDPQ